MNSNKTRRVACDRCRDQKLRCPRVDSTVEQCARCLRARAICVTSSARPNGRPRKPPLPVADQLPAGPSVQANTPLWTAGASLDAYPDFVGSSVYPSATETPLLGQAETSKRQTPSPSQTVSGTTSLFGFELPGEESNGGFKELDFGSNMDRTEGNFPENLADFDLGWTMQCVGDMDVDGQSVTSTTLVDPRIRFSKLSENIAQQLNRVRTYSWRPPDVQANCLAKGQSIDQNPLAQALQCTSELAAVLQQLSCTPSFPESSRPNPHEPPASAVSTSTSAPSPSTGEPPGAPTILLILATWLQLTELYDKLFGYVCDTLQQMPAETITAFRGPMGMIGSQVPGMGLMQGDLSIKIMIEVIKHQLESVEVVLGLPDEYSIVPRNGGIIGNTSATGLFSRQDMELSGLLKAVMTGMPSAPGKAAIDSLKDKIKTVQGILGTSVSSH